MHELYIRVFLEMVGLNRVMMLSAVDVVRVCLSSSGMGAFCFWRNAG